MESISKLDYNLPEDCDSVVGDAISQLLRKQPQDRLGFWNIAEIKQHSMFEGVTLEGVQQELEVDPRA
jgi:hypothetical protein